MGEYVEKAEFNQWKEEVKELKQELGENKPILHEIERKVDIINEKVTTSDKIEELKLKPLYQQIDVQKKEIDELKDNQKWLRRTILSSVIVMIFEAIGLVFAFLK